MPPSVSAGLAAWNRLVVVERAVVGRQDALVANEARIGALTTTLAMAATAADATAPRALPRDAGELRATLAAHDQLAAAYQQALADEYGVYHGVALDRQAGAAMLQQAAAAGPPVRDAVAYNLQVVATQLEQEQAIRAAVGPAGGTAVAPSGARLLAPVVAPVTQPFGPTAFALEPPLTYGGVFYPHFHTGLDIAAPLDTPVRAAAGGTVVLAGASVDRAGHLVGYGNYVVVDHGGLVTLYGHLERLLVRAGDSVVQGQAIGLEGSTGWSTGPHLHFEVRHGDAPVDPLGFIAGELAPS